uniref:Peptidase A2 domain-containing protein n=1 Tax=Anopheles dirus TaxID=7168 RepID=A0A182NDE6_9DIPT
MQQLSAMIAQALKTAIGNASGLANGDNATPKAPTFSHPPFHASDGSTVEDYFNRLEWALKLSNIPTNKYADYAREIPYADLRKTLENHFDRKKNKFVESVKFRNIVQQKGETIAQLVLGLKQGAAYCEYDNFLDRMLIEQMLHGLEARDICDEVIAKNPSSFNDALDIVLGLEATRNTVREISTASPVTSSEATHKLGYEKPPTKRQKTFRRTAPHKQQPPATHSAFTHEQRQSASKTEKSNNAAATPCNGCGGPHLRSVCRFRNALYNTCKKMGHISKVCRSGSTPRDHLTADHVPTYHIDSVQPINSVRNSALTIKLMVDVNIDGKCTKMELDTGAPCGIMSETTLRSIKARYFLKPTDRQFTSYTGHRINCLGRLPVK